MSYAVWVFIVLPLTLYVVLFAVETIWSIMRLFRPTRAVYFQNTWEITHTILVFALNSTIWLFSSRIVDIAHVVATPLCIVAALFLVRSMIYIHLFYVRETRVVGVLFAVTNVFIIATLAVVCVRALGMTFPEPNTAIIPYLWPGLFITLCLCIIPAVHVYRVHTYDSQLPNPSLAPKQ
jgi:hypothetical protein